MSAILLPTRILARLALACGLLAALAPAAGASTGEWAHRRAISIDNANAGELRDFQVRVELNAGNFDFDRARPDGADLRFTDVSGDKVLGHWVERYDAAAQEATVWVKVPVVPPVVVAALVAPVATKVATTTGASEIPGAYLYYGNPAAEDLSSGGRTFEMFDDFGQPGLGYYAFGPPTTIMTRSLAWETQAPHTLSVVELNREGYKYWGYYGLADCGGIGIARSNDLVTWDRLPEPLLNADGERWPAALEVDGTVYMVYDRDHCGTSHVVMRTSADGRAFSPDYAVIVPLEVGVRNQNPALFRDPSTGRFHLYWFRGGGDAGFWQIKMRSADTVPGLADAASERVLIDVPYELAAPNMMYADGTYFLSTEVNENAWKTKIYAGPSPEGPFAPLPDAPQLSDNQACLFQHPIGGTMHGYICKVMGTEWVLNHRAADLAQGRVAQRTLDQGVWTVLAGDWAPAEAEGDIVLRAGGAGLLRTALTGGDAVIEARGRSAGARWGVAARVQADGSSVVASVRPDGAVEIGRLTGGRYAALSEGRIPDFAAGRWHTLGLHVHGGQAEARIDGQVVTTAGDGSADLPAGSAGLWADGVSGGEFDDVRWRKFAPREPSARVGSREDRPADGAGWLSAARVAPVLASPPAPASIDAPDDRGDSPVLVLMAALVTALGAGIVVVGLARNRG